MENRSRDNLLQHAIWLYGVIVGFAIEKALSDVVPRIFAASDDAAGAAALSKGDLLSDIVRLIIFLAVIIRFYLGAVIFFDSAHKGSSEKAKREFALDFLFGVAHFILFFGWAFSINTANNATHLFPAILAIILLYDLLWFVACKGFDTQKHMKLWMIVNSLTVIICAAIYFITLWLTKNPAIAEFLAFAVVLFVSLLDIIELVSRKKFFRTWFAWAIKG